MSDEQQNPLTCNHVFLRQDYASRHCCEKCEVTITDAQVVAVMSGDALRDAYERVLVMAEKMRALLYSEEKS